MMNTRYLRSPNSSYTKYNTPESINALRIEFQSKFEFVEFTNFDRDELVIYIYNLRNFFQRKEYTNCLYLCKQMITGLTFGTKMEYYYVNSYPIIITCLLQIYSIINYLLIYTDKNSIQEVSRWIDIIDEEFDDEIRLRVKSNINNKRKFSTIFDEEFLYDIVKRQRIE